MARQPCQKGTSVLPVVEALKQHPDRERLVPRELWKYFDDHLLISGWYPERDYFALVEALSKTIDAKSVGGDVWRAFAVFSAQRDIAGLQAQVVGSTTTGPMGVYRSFMQVASGDPGAFFTRASKLWSQYHDTGNMDVRGGRANTNSVVLRLTGFHIPLEGFVRLQGYYLEEFGRLVGLPLECTVKRSTTRGDKFCEWECVLPRTPTTEAYVAALPQIL